MPTSSESNPAFDRQFAALCSVAQWNESVGGQSAWFRSTKPDGQYYSEMWELQSATLKDSASSYRFAEGPTEPDWLDNDNRESLNLSYLHQQHGPGDGLLVTTKTLDRWGWQRDRNGNWRRPSPTATIKPATVGRVCVRWCSLVDNFDQLAHVTGTYIDYLTIAGQEAIPGDNNRIGLASMHRSLVIATDHSKPYAQAAPYVDIIAGLDSTDPAHLTIREVAANVIGNILIGRELQKQWPTQKFRKSLLFEATECLDERGLLSNEWWMGTGIAAGGVFADTDLLRKVYEKVAAEDGAELVAHLPPETAQALIKTYIAGLINHYAGKYQGSKEIKAVKRIVIDKRGSADLSKLIDTAKAISIAHNNQAAPEERLPLLSRQEMRDVGDALHIILNFIRPESLTDEQWAAQLEEDVLHAEIVDILHARLRKGRTESLERALDTLHLRYPWANDSELQDIRDQLNAGKPPSAVRAWVRTRNKAARRVAAFKIKKTGSGLIS